MTHKDNDELVRFSEHFELNQAHEFLDQNLIDRVDLSNTELMQLSLVGRIKLMSGRYEQLIRELGADLEELQQEIKELKAEREQC